MRNVPTAWMVLALLLSITASAQNTNPGSGGMKKIEPLPRDLEIQLALSALPMNSTHLLRERVTIRSEGRGLLRNTGTTFSIQSLSMRLDPRRSCASSWMRQRCKPRELLPKS